MNSPQQREQTFRPPSATAIFIVVLATLTGYLLNHWHPWSTPAAFVTGLLGLSQVVRFFDDLFKLRAYRQRRKAFKDVGKEYGQSDFGTIDDAREAGLSISKPKRRKRIS